MRLNKPTARFRRFVRDIRAHTPFIQMVVLLVVLWLVFSAGVYLAERDVEGTVIDSYGSALYWGVAAFSSSSTISRWKSSIC